MVVNLFYDQYCYKVLVTRLFHISSLQRCHGAEMALFVGPGGIVPSDHGEAVSL